MTIEPGLLSPDDNRARLHTSVSCSPGPCGPILAIFIHWLKAINALLNVAGSDGFLQKRSHLSSVT